MFSEADDSHPLLVWTESQDGWSAVSGGGGGGGAGGKGRQKGVQMLSQSWCHCF